MNLNSFIAILIGVSIRLIAPLVLTGLVVYWLRKLDARWQAEAKRERDMLVKGETPCWIEQGLSVEESRLRAAMSEQPCWQIYRLPNGYLDEACLDCEVFRDAPIPNPKHSHAHI